MRYLKESKSIIKEIKLPYSVKIVTENKTLILEKNEIIKILEEKKKFTLDEIIKIGHGILENYFEYPEYASAEEDVDKFANKLFNENNENETNIGSNSKYTSEIERSFFIKEFKRFIEDKFL